MRSPQELLLEIESLSQKVGQLEQDKLDLQIELETTIEHGDAIERQLCETNEQLQTEIAEKGKAQSTLQKILETLTRDNQDLQIMLDMIAEHGDSVEYQLYNQAVEFMRRSEEQFRAIAEATPIVMMISHMSNGIITYANSTSMRTLGIDAKNLATHKLQDFYFDLSDREILLNILETDGYVRSYEMKVKRADGNIIWVTASLHPLSLTGETTFLTTFYDITERKQVEFALQISEAQLRQQAEELEHRVEQRTSELKKANRAKSEFLANMSHELRTPLNAVLGFTQLMIADVTLSADHQETLSIIQSSGEHLLSLINDVLQMSKIEAGRITLNISSFDLYSLLDRLKNMLRLKAEAEGIFLLFDYGSDIPQYIETDEIKLSQVLINLLSNSLKFTQSGGVTLSIRTLPNPDPTINPDSENLDRKNPPAYLLFTIEDTGIGIAETELATIFEAFVQSDSGRKSKEGTGLGLAISRKFVQLMGGDIAVTSTLGSGTVFIFNIEVGLNLELNEILKNELVDTYDQPIQEIKYQVIEPITESRQESSLRILLAEDNQVNRKVAVRMLSKLGYTADVAINGIEVLEALSRQSYDLILMDIQMPEMDGIEATRQICTLFKPEVRPMIVALTANAMEEERDRCLEAGMNHHLSKPVRLEELQAILDYCRNAVNSTQW